MSTQNLYFKTKWDSVSLDGQIQIAKLINHLADKADNEDTIIAQIKSTIATT